MKILVVAFLVLMKTAVSQEDSDPMDPPPPIEPCRDVFVNFGPCMGFVEGIYRNPSPDCCRGVSHLNNVVRFTAPGTIHGNGETRRVCACIEMMANANNHLPFLPSGISNLPLRCSLTLSFPISIAMDCSQFRNTKDLNAEISN
ncbi:PREDICTED: protein ARABIDOPSIS THALIANA ANTHER 7-like [Camelina sativa]|uniref:Protein ARABIDOPSIS THALIANA ANTHER 7-like n=1 Tax=Camelina sativa TaxID=90675 RepID=A0ABM0UY13_CAMSA|nr:PREDICTED: protein ARABIDOPSIS THALIANA ANTHER 7-like [Camelina sativa]